MTAAKQVVQRAARELRHVFAAYPTGVAAVAALVDGRPVGIAASSFVPVSMDPPLVSVCMAHTSSTWPLLRERPRIGISVLGAHQEAAGRSLGAREGDRFADVSWRDTADGCVLIDDAAAWFDTTVEQQVRAGDHDIVLFRVEDSGVAVADDAHIEPLVFHGSAFRRLT